ACKPQARRQRQFRTSRFGGRLRIRAANQPQGELAMAIPDPLTILVALNHTANPPDGINVPARDLSQEQARDLCVYYALNNMLALEKPITFGKDTKPTWPKVGDKSTLGLTIAGVNFSPDNSAASGLTRTGRMDLRTAVLAVRLAQYVRSNWGTSVLYWG